MISLKKELFYLWPPMEEIETRTVKATFDGRVLLTVVMDNMELDVAEVLENFEACERLTRGRPYLSLVISAPYTTVTKEAREELNHPRFYEHAVAQAIVVKSLASRIMGNFLIRLYKKYCPQRLFTNRDEALKWLEQHWVKQKQLAD